MRILHTADWHLGQTFYEYDRRLEHQLFFEWLKQQIDALDIEVLLIAGDVFDSPNPSAESQRLYYTFLRRVTTAHPDLQIIIIAGNHDSAARLEAPNPLLEGMNVTVRGVVKRCADGSIDWNHLIVPIYGPNGTGKGDDCVAYCLAVPFLRQGDYPPAESYAEGVAKLYQQLYEQVKGEGKPVMAMGHLQATGSEISVDDRSERTVIGGLECISPTSFDEGLIYTALGHLHRGQRVSKRENIRYAGTPIPMSFAEKNNVCGAMYVEYVAGTTTIKRLEFDSPVRLLSVPRQPERLETVLDAIGELPEGELTAASPYLEVKIRMMGPEPSYKYKVEEALKGKSVRLARIVALLPTKTASGITAANYEELQTIRPLEMAFDVFRRKYGGEEMPNEMKELLEAVVKEESR